MVFAFTDVTSVTVFAFGDTGDIQVAVAAYVEEDLLCV